MCIILPHVDWPAQCLVQRKSKRNIQKEKIETDKRRKHFFHTFLYLLGGWTNQRYVPRHSVVPKTPDSKIGVVGSTSLPEKENGSQKTWVFISLHRLQIRYSKILLILARPLPIGYFTLLFFFFLIFNRMDAWSLMRGDAFIHFVSGSRRVNIQLGVLLLIPKSPQIHPPLMMAQSWAESTWKITNNGKFINQFPPNIIRSIRQFERINKKNM